MIRDSFIKLGRETKSPFITNPFRFAGVEWATALTNWLKRKPLTINGAKKTADAVFGDLSDQVIEDFTTYSTQGAADTDWVTNTSTAYDRVNLATDKLDFRDSVDGNNPRCSRDLTSVSDEKWVIDFDLDITTFTAYSAGAEAARIGIGMWSTDNTTSVQSNSDFLGFFINSNGSKYNATSCDGQSLLGGTDKAFTNTPAVELLYVRMIRLDSTHFQVTLYADSDRTEIIETQTVVTASTVSTLRYFGVRGNGISGSTSDIRGTLVNIEFYDGVTTVENIPSQQTATFIDDFDTDDWDDVGTDVQVGSGLIDYDCAVNDVEHSTSYDLQNISGFTFADPKKWSMRWKQTFTTLTSGGTSDCALHIGLSSNLAESRTAQNFVGLFLNVSTAGIGLQLRQSSGGGAPYTTAGSGFSDDPATGETFYFELIRESETLARLNMYSDSNYSILVETVTDVISSAHSDLRYIRVFNDSEGSGTNTNTLIGTLDDLSFWNGITEVNPATLTDYPVPIKIIGDTNLQRKTVETRDEPFTADGWVDTGSNYGVDITNEVLNWNATDSSANNGSAYDLTSVSNSAWTLDFDLFSNVTAGADATANVTHFGISGESQATAETTSQDYIGMRIKRGSTVNEIAIIQSENPTAPSGGTSSAFTLTAQDLDGKTVFVRIQRLSTTAGAIMIFADSAHTILLERKDLTLPSGLDTLRYLRVFSGATQDSTENSTLNGTVKNLKFWNGITNPVTQETATLDDDFSTDNWTDSGSDISVDAVTNNRLDYTVSNSVPQDDATAYDLQDVLGSGINADDEKWCMRFKHDLTSYSTNTAANGKNLCVYLSDKDQDTEANNGTQSGIGMRLVTFSSNNLIRTRYKSNGNWMDGLGSNLSRALQQELLYIEIKRISRNKMQLNLYSDSEFSILLESQEETMSENPINLRYIKVQLETSAGSPTGNFVGHIDDLSFWNGISSPNAIGRKFVFTNDAFDGNAVEYSSENVSYDPINGDWTGYVKIPSLTAGADTTIQMYYDYAATNPSYVPEALPPTFEDDFSGTDDWTDTSTNPAVSTTNDRLDFDADGTGIDQVSYIDIGTTVTGNYVIRFKTTLTTVTTNTDGTPQSVLIGLSDDTSLESADTQDFVGLRIRTRNSGNTYDVMAKNGSLAGSTDQDSTFTRTPTTETVYTEIIDNGSTITINQYSDEYSTLYESQTGSFDLTGGQYLKVMIEEGDGTGNGRITGYVDNIKFYNGVIIPDREQSTYDSNYKAVYHLQGNSIDSTAYGNDGTDTAVDWQQQNNSVGLLSSGASTDINVGSDASLDNIFDGGGMISCYINPLSNGEAANARIIDKSSTGWTYRVSNESAGTIDVVFLVETSGTIGRWETTTALTLGELNKVDLYYNSDNVTTAPIFIINGNKVSLTQTSTPTGTRADDSASNMRIGDSNAGGESFDGFIDNVKLSDKTRPSSEAITSYNAEKSDSDIITKGDELTQ